MGAGFCWHHVPSLKVHLWLWFHLHPGSWHRLRSSVLLNEQRNGVIMPSGVEASCERRNETFRSSNVPSVRDKRDAWGRLFRSPELQSPLRLLSARLGCVRSSVCDVALMSRQRCSHRYRLHRPCTGGSADRPDEERCQRERRPGLMNVAGSKVAPEGWMEAPERAANVKRCSGNDITGRGGRGLSGPAAVDPTVSTATVKLTPL